MLRKIGQVKLFVLLIVLVCSNYQIYPSQSDSLPVVIDPSSIYSNIYDIISDYDNQLVPEFIQLQGHIVRYTREIEIYDPGSTTLPFDFLQKIKAILRLSFSTQRLNQFYDMISIPDLVEYYLHISPQRVVFGFRWQITEQSQAEILSERFNQFAENMLPNMGELNYYVVNSFHSYYNQDSIYVEWKFNTNEMINQWNNFFQSRNLDVIQRGGY